MAFVNPDNNLRGEWANAETIYQNQIAATLSSFLGLDFHATHPEAGRPVARVLRK